MSWLRARLRTLLLAALVALLVGMTPATGRSAPPPEGPCVWVLRIIGERTVAERALFGEGTTAERIAADRAAAERAPWALVRPGERAITRLGSNGIESQLLEGEVDFLGSSFRGSTLERKLAGQSLEHLFVEGDLARGAPGRRVLYLQKGQQFSTNDLRHADHVFVDEAEQATTVARMAPGKRVLLLRSNTPLTNLSALDRPVRRIKIIHAIPRTPAEARIVHGPSAELPTQATLDRLHAQVRSLAVTRQTTSGQTAVVSVVDVRPPSGKTVSQAMLEEIRNGPEELKLAIGHIAHGRMLFPDGTAALAEDLVERAMVALLGCDSARALTRVEGAGVVTLRELMYDEAIGIARRMTGPVRRASDTPATFGKVIDAANPKTAEDGDLVAGLFAVIGLVSPAAIWVVGRERETQ